VTEIQAVPTLDGFARLASSLDGVQLRQLTPMTRLVVETQNSLYRLIVAGDGHVIVEGGRFFERPTEVVFEGASGGGSCLKVGWVTVGLRMEIRDRDRRIVTSPVHRILVDDKSLPGVH
jgi:hypothetical protein